MKLIRTATRLTCAVALSTATVVLSSGAAQAAAPSNGCPAGYQLVPVAPLTALGYRVPALVDSPASNSFGQPGNSDGLVCSVQLGNRVGLIGPIYNFIDNQLPAT